MGVLSMAAHFHNNEAGLWLPDFGGGGLGVEGFRGLGFRVGGLGFRV